MVRVKEVPVLTLQVERQPKGLSIAHLLPGEHREQIQDLFMVWAHLNSSADLGQAQFILAGAHSHICSPEV